MNIWSLQKDISIKHLLLLLSNEFPPHSYVISNASSVDHKAIRLCHSDLPSMCSYIYTYGHLQERYGIHLEYPDESDIEVSNSVEIQENIGYTRLLELLKVHFDISDF